MRLIDSSHSSIVTNHRLYNERWNRKSRYLHYNCSTGILQNLCTNGTNDWLLLQLPPYKRVCSTTECQSAFLSCASAAATSARLGCLRRWNWPQRRLEISGSPYWGTAKELHSLSPRLPFCNYPLLWGADHNRRVKLCLSTWPRVAFVVVFSAPLLTSNALHTLEPWNGAVEAQRIAQSKSWKEQLQKDGEIIAWPGI